MLAGTTSAWHFVYPFPLTTCYAMRLLKTRGRLFKPGLPRSRGIGHAAEADGVLIDIPE